MVTVYVLTKSFSSSVVFAQHLPLQRQDHVHHYLSLIFAQLRVAYKDQRQLLSNEVHVAHVSSFIKIYDLVAKA